MGQYSCRTITSGESNTAPTNLAILSCTRLRRWNDYKLKCCTFYVAEQRQKLKYWKGVSDNPWEVFIETPYKIKEKRHTIGISVMHKIIITSTRWGRVTKSVNRAIDGSDNGLSPYLNQCCSDSFKIGNTFLLNLKWNQIYTRQGNFTMSSAKFWPFVSASVCGLWL